TLVWVFSRVPGKGSLMYGLKQLRGWYRRLGKGWSRTLARGGNAAGRLALRPLMLIWSWGRARNWVYLGQGLPAFAACAAVLAVPVMWLALPAQEVEARYQDRAQAALASKDFPTALVCYERLAALGKDRPENVYALGLALEAQGQPERAFEIMDQLAPIERVGHGPAHLWLAIYYWRDLGEPKSRKRAERHLQHALQTELPDPDAAHGLMGELDLLWGRP